MTPSALSQTSAAPHPASWLFAVISLAFALTAAAAGVAFNLKYRIWCAQNGVIETLEHGDTIGSRKLLEEITVERPLERLVTSPTERERRRMKADAAHELLTLSDQIRSARLAAVTGSIGRVKRLLPPLFETTQGLSRQWDETLPLLQANVTALRAEQQAREQQDQARTECSEAIKVFATQGERFGKLLGRPYRSPADCLSVAVYTEGVFSGLPLLDRIPNGLPDLAAAKEAIDAAGGVVSVTGNDAHQEFTAELDTIRALATAAYDRIHQNQVTLANGGQQSAASRTMRAQEIDRTQRQVARLITTLLQTDHSLLTEFGLAAPAADNQNFS